MGDVQDLQDLTPVDATSSTGPLRSVGGWAAGLSNLTKLIVAATTLVVAGAGLIAALGLKPDTPSGKSIETAPTGVLGATPAPADHCATNRYIVDLAATNTAQTGVYEDPSTRDLIKWKRDGDIVTGPNSYENYSNGYRAVYSHDAKDGIGWIRADNLHYDKCTEAGMQYPIR
jgi:hypothetical protein